MREQKKKHCLMVKPKKMLSVYSRISLFNFISISLLLKIDNQKNAESSASF